MTQNRINAPIVFSGTFTPTYSGSTTPGSTVYTSQFGFYTVFGNIVIAQVSITLSSTTATGDLILQGLPFTIKNQTNGVPVNEVRFSSTTWTFPANTEQCILQGIVNTNTAKLLCIGASATSGAYMQIQNLSSNNIAGSLIYMM